MVDKTTGELTQTTNLTGSEKVHLENGAGNSRYALTSLLKAFASEDVEAALATHIADETTHGISSYFSSLTGVSGLAALLAALGFTLTGTASSGKFSFGGLFVVTWRNHSVAGSTSVEKAYGDDHVYSSWARAWLEGDDFDGPENGIDIGINAHGTSGATVQNGSANAANIILFSIGV